MSLLGKRPIVYSFLSSVYSPVTCPSTCTTIRALIRVLVLSGLSGFFAPFAPFPVPLPLGCSIALCEPLLLSTDIMAVETDRVRSRIIDFAGNKFQWHGGQQV